MHLKTMTTAYGSDEVGGDGFVFEASLPFPPWICSSSTTTTTSSSSPTPPSGFIGCGGD